MIINDKVYGQQEVNDELIINLINSKELERLKGVNQYGTYNMIDEKYNTTRFDHSLGVFFLLGRFGADKEERIAGLIHDVNHSAFSHLIDYIFGNPQIQDFGDSRHKDIVMNSTIPSLLEKRNISIKKICEPHNFGLLEREIPDLCCDRLDYCLRDSICYGFITQTDAEEMLDGLTVHDGEIVCKDKESASKIAKLFLKTSKSFWGNRFQAGSYHLLAKAAKIAFKEGIIKEEDFYTTDDFLFEKLMNSKNEEIIKLLDGISEENIIEGTKEDHDFIGKSKARYIDPKFLENNKLIRLSEADKDFKKEIDDYKDWIGRGFYIKLRK